MLTSQFLILAVLLLIDKALLYSSGIQLVHQNPHLTTRFAASNDLEELLDPYQRYIYIIAKKAAHRAGERMLKGLGNIELRKDVESKIGSRDIVTQVDKDCQATIKSIITNEFPSHQFLGEEDVNPGILASTTAMEELCNAKQLWIVDPLDGTTNFAHGMPLSGVIIAYAEYGVCKFGLIFDPFRSEIFSAWKGKGAYLNGNRISCCNTRSLCDAVVSTGSPPNLEALDACLRATNLLSAQVRTMRMLGSAAIMLSWVACGRLTAYFEADLNAWDLCAGCLIVQEAGGMVTDTWGNKHNLTTRNLVASNGYIHEDLRSRLLSSEMWIKSKN